MRRPICIALLLTAVPLAVYLLVKPALAPADPNHPIPGGPATAQLVPIVDVPEAAQTATSTASPPLPITQVVLYSSGVGYFQRDGQVDESARVDLTFPASDVNDLLKSMVLQDLGGGHISAVSFDSHDPIDKTLNSFAIHLTNNPTHTQILSQARGEKVEITLPYHYCATPGETPSGQPALGTLRGNLVGIEMKPAAGKESVEMLNLWCAEGMRSVPLADVQRVKFLNPAVQHEVERALEVLASGHDTEKKAVSLHFSGSGKRPVSVGYVVETSLWRTSYRVLVGKDGKPFVQGWAVVQNPTNEDWKDVRMSLVSGRPISFKMDLYQPMYATRPVVQQEVQAALVPTTHSGGVPVSDQILSRAGLPAEYTAAPGVAPVPAAMNGRMLGGALPPMVVNPVSPQKQPEINLNRGIVAATTATDFGASFEYAIEHPVNVPRQKSALLPIVNKALDGGKVSLYSPQVHAKHPLLALRLKNTTAVHLMQGPVAVFEGTGYCGDAQLPELGPGEERLISYALDLGTEVEPVHGPTTDRLISIHLHQGLLHSTTRQRHAVTYVIKNRGPQDRLVLLEHAERPGYKLVSADQPKERAPNLYRFEVKVPAGKTVPFEVIEEEDIHQSIILVKSSEDTIRYYMQGDLSNARTRPALEKLLALKAKLAATHEELDPLEQQMAKLTRDQDRLRASLKEMPVRSEAYRRTVTKFDDLDVAIEKLQKQIDALQARAQKQYQGCEVYANSLDEEVVIKKELAVWPQVTPSSFGDPSRMSLPYVGQGTGRW
jgi:hypothetical protein